DALVWQGSGMRSLATDARTLRFSPDGTLAVVAGPKAAAPVIDVRTGRTQATLDGHTNDVSSATFTPDGRLVVTSSFDKTASVWRPDGAPVRTLADGGDPVLYAAVSPDGDRIVTTHASSLVRV